MIGRLVIFKSQEGGDVRAKVIDKVIMTKSHFENKGVMNEASFHVYVGKTDEGEIVLFRPDWITVVLG